MWWHNNHTANYTDSEGSSQPHTYNCNYDDDDDDSDNDDKSSASCCPSFDAPLQSQLRHLPSEAFYDFSQSFQGKYQVSPQPLPTTFSPQLSYRSTVHTRSHCHHGYIQNKHIKYRVIRNDCHGFNNLPSRSPGATPSDFFLWDYVKDQV